MAPDRPHVFVVHGDLTQLACDAIMIPTDARLSVRHHWHGVVPEHAELRDRPELRALRSGKAFAHALDPVLDANGEEVDPDAPLRVLTTVPLNGFQSVEELRPRINKFILVARRAVALHRGDRSTSQVRRALPLVAMPLFASGGGGGGMRRTALIDTVLDEARAAAEMAEVDVAIVVRKEEDAALAQQRRRTSAAASWAAVEPRLVEHAQRLAAHALADRMVPFMGAGVSMSAGAPSWSKLLEDLATLTELDDETRKALLNGTLNELDQASYLEARFAEQKKDFRSAVADLVERPRYGLAPALIAATADEQAITLNYDTLFERASEAAGRPRRVLTGGGRSDLAVDGGGAMAGDRWLLKLHGSATHPESIVLTRGDYLGFASDRSALSAIVKANLLTRHLLFVGFGLADDHFHEIVHDVKRAVGDTATSATALTLFDDPLTAGLWSTSLTIVPMLTEQFTPDAVPRAARTLELFLDALAAYSIDSESYLRDDRYAEGLTDMEREIRERLLALEALSGNHYSPSRSQ